jgi:phosphate transport system substrate-binding protein
VKSAKIEKSCPRKHPATAIRKMGITPPSAPESTPANAETKQSGKNISDIIYHLIQHPLRLVGVALTVIIFLAVILAFIEKLAKPGTKIDISLGSIGYIKNDQLVNTPLQPTGANSYQKLRVCGSDTIGSDLMPMIATGFLSHQGFGTAKREEVKGEGKALTAQKKGTEEGLTVEISTIGTNSGIDSLVDGNCDIAMVSRELNTVEYENLQGAVTKSVVNGRLRKEVIAKDGIAVIVNRANTLDSLNYSQLSDIFSGKIKDWKEVNSSQSGKISLTLLDKKSGTRKEFENEVLIPFDKTMSPSVEFEDQSNIKVSNKVSENETAIGFVAYPYVGNAKSLRLSKLSKPADGKDKVEPLYPSPQSIRVRTYVLSRNLYLIATKANPLVNNFIDFALNDEGQQFVERAGFVTYKTRVGHPTTSGTAEDEYARTIKAADSQLMNVFFPTDDSKPEENSLNELKKYLPFFREVIREGRRILLLGFTDETGDDKQNLILSRKRAETIQKILIQDPDILTSMSKSKISNKPIQIIVVPFGSIRPIASNKTDDSKALNRRVEIWVK